ncbi:hypothetical protein L7F22_034214 [Adiantum nelumboides]|nr:hypothetical protein [Adiantum nelumboides]
MATFAAFAVVAALAIVPALAIIAAFAVIVAALAIIAAFAVIVAALSIVPALAVVTAFAVIAAFAAVVALLICIDQDCNAHHQKHGQEQQGQPLVSTHARACHYSGHQKFTLLNADGHELQGQPLLKPRLDAVSLVLWRRLSATFHYEARALASPVGALSTITT